MHSRLRSPAGRIGVALICLLVLIQTGCTSFELSPSLAPGSGGTDPGTDPDGGTERSSTSNIVGIATLAVVGGYILYKLVIQKDEENAAGEVPNAAPQALQTIRPSPPDTSLYKPLPGRSPQGSLDPPLLVPH
jgi:hypothetical protein